jgi:hypothetical protein
MKLPFVSRKRYEIALDNERFLRGELTKRSSLTIPMITMRGIGEVRLVGTPETLKQFQDYIEKKGIKWKKEV